VRTEMRIINKKRFVLISLISAGVGALAASTIKSGVLSASAAGLLTAVIVQLFFLNKDRQKR